MCEVKSMILLKDRVYCPANTDSHSKMLNDLGIKDDRLQADFVKIEITPPNNDFFAPVEDWLFSVDQDNTPDWYVPELDKKRAVEALEVWANTHIFVGKNNFEIAGDGFFYIKNCKNVAVKNATVEACDNSTVEACGCSTVKASGNSTVEAYDNATVKAFDKSTIMAYDNTTIKAFDNATVKASDNATVEACDNATIKACGNATVKAFSNATVKAFSNSTVEAFGNSTVKAYNNSTVIISTNSYAKKEQVTLNENSTLKDCVTKTIYQSGDWKFVKVEQEEV
jgi:hypothetical protein